MNATNSPPSARISTGIEGLDRILGGGLPSNRFYLVEGSSGTGKTTLALQFLLAGIRSGESGLCVALAETREELRAVAQSHGWSLDGLSIFDLAVSEKSLRSDEQYTLFHPSEVELGETTKTILREVERVQPRRVVLDSVSELRLLASEPLRYRREIRGLKHFFDERRCTVLLLDDQSSESSDHQLQSVVHGVIGLEHGSPGYGAARRRLRVLKLREVKFLGGYHDFNIETGGIVVYPRLVAAESHPGFQRAALSSGIAGLDALLGGGLEAGTATLMMGPAGTGKSVLAAQYLFAAAEQGKHGAYFIFDEVRSTLLVRTARLGIDLQKHVRAGACTVRQVDPAELSPGEFSHLVRQSVEQNQAAVVVIDSVNGYHQAMPEEHFLAAYMHELVSYLSQQGVTTVLILGQYGLFGSQMSAPVDLSYLVDTILLLRYFETAGEVRRAISVVKKRTGQHERAIREFGFGAGGVRIGEPLQEFQGVLTGSPQYVGESIAVSGEDNDGPDG